MFGVFSKVTSLIPRTLYAFGASIILMPLSLANGVLIARTVGPQGKGALDLILATSGLLVMILGFSLSPGVTYVIAQGKANLSALTKRLLIVAAAQTALSLIVLLIIRQTKYASTFLALQVGSWLIIGTAVLVLLELTNAHWRAMLFGRHAIATVNNVEIFAKVTQFVLLFATAFILVAKGMRVSVGILFAITVSISALTNVALLTNLRSALAERGGTDGLREVVRFSLPSYFGNLVQFLNYRLDVFVVSLFAGYAALGRYTLAVGLGQLLWLLSNAAATVLLPKIAAGNQVDQIGHVMRVNRLVLAASFVGALMLATVGSRIIPLLYGVGFNGSVPALVWILPGIVAFSSVNVLAAYLAGIGKPRLNAKVAVISLIATISLDLILIPRFDIVGAAIASTVSYVVSAVLTIILFRRESSRPSWRKLLFPTSEDIRFTIGLAQPFLRRASAARSGVA